MRRARPSSGARGRGAPAERGAVGVGRPPASGAWRGSVGGGIRRASVAHPLLLRSRRMNAAEATNYYFRKAARIMDVGERIETLLATPLREVKVQVSIELDSGEIRTFIGYRVQHDNSRGPMKGGLRYHPTVDAGRGGGAGVADDVEDRGGEPALRRRQGRHHLRPRHACRLRELERLTRKFVDQIHDVIGPHARHPRAGHEHQPAGDGVDHRPVLEVPRPLAGGGHRQAASSSTARRAARRPPGAACSTSAARILRDLGLPLKGTRFAVQGFGNVGSHVARLSARGRRPGGGGARRARRREEPAGPRRARALRAREAHRHGEGLRRRHGLLE